MSMAYIRSTYGVPAKRGARVRHTTLGGMVILGRITSADYRLRVTLDEPIKGFPMKVYLHPAWRIEYLDATA